MTRIVCSNSLSFTDRMHDALEQLGATASDTDYLTVQSAGVIRGGRIVCMNTVRAPEPVKDYTGRDGLVRLVKDSAKRNRREARRFKTARHSFV